MIDLFISALEPLGYPIFRQGSMSKDDAYPDSFFTFWNNDSVSDDFYDNVENVIIWDLDLNFYSTDPILVDEMLVKAKQKLEKNDFIVSGYGYDVASDEITHTGRGINVRKIQIKGEN